MNSSRKMWISVAFVAAGALLAAAPGCSCGSDDTNGGSSSTSGNGGGIHTGGFGQGGQGNQGGNACGNADPSCTDNCTGPTCDPAGEFPMPTDDPPPDNVTADGVTKDENGYIVLDSTKSKSDSLWVADDMNYYVGFVSKVRTKPFTEAPFYREVGRYPTVTCFSDAVNGSKEGAVLGQNPPGNLCADQVHGCCARDVVSGAGHGIQLLYNRPSRTAVDLNGDVWVANRAHSGQASVTKIADDVQDCVDRNGNNQIDTSSDLNNDGIITTDCNDDNLPDDFNTQCSPGKSHEFFGLDDECVLFTVNTGTGSQLGRPLALGPDPDRPTGPSDAWMGLFNTGQFFRIDGLSGLVEQTVQIQPQNGVDSHPYGAAIDFFGILWASNVNQGYLFYFDTNDPSQQGMVEYPGGGFYGIAIDGYSEAIPDDNLPIQQIWLGDYSGGAGAGAYRYRPIRDQGFWGLGQGTWAKAVFDYNPNAPGFEVRQGRGLGADNRQPTSFVWLALDGYPTGTTAFIGRIPIDIPDNTITTLGGGDMLDSSQYGMTGAGVAADLDVWGVNQESSSAVHFAVDATGNVVSGPDVVPLDDKPNSPESFCGFGSCKPHPYTYSDFTGFGLRNFTNPQGYYAWVESGHCDDGETEYLSVSWDAETPPDTAITMMARSAPDKPGLQTAQWTGKYPSSPADLKLAPGPLNPNPTNFIEVLFELTTKTDVSPKLKSFHIVSHCIQNIPQ